MSSRSRNNKYNHRLLQFYILLTSVAYKSTKNITNIKTKHFPDFERWPWFVWRALLGWPHLGTASWPRPPLPRWFSGLWHTTPSTTRSTGCPTITENFANQSTGNLFQDLQNCPNQFMTYLHYIQNKSNGHQNLTGTSKPSSTQWLHSPNSPNSLNSLNSCKFAFRECIESGESGWQMSVECIESFCVSFAGVICKMDQWTWGFIILKAPVGICCLWSLTEDLLPGSNLRTFCSFVFLSFGAPLPHCRC